MVLAFVTGHIRYLGASKGLFNRFLSADSSEFSDRSSGIRLANDWRVAAICFPEEEENKCPWSNCRLGYRVEGNKSRAIIYVGNI